MGRRKTCAAGVRMSEPVELFLNNIDYGVTEEDIQVGLSDLGRISRCHIGRDENGKSRGFAIVRILPHDSLEDTINKAYGRQLNGRGIHVEKARPRQEADPWARR